MYMKHLGFFIVACFVLGAEFGVCHPSGAGSCDAPKDEHKEASEGDGGYELIVNHTGPAITPGKAVDLVLRHKNGQEFTGFQIIAEEGEFLSLPPGVQKNTRHCSLDGRITHTNKEPKSEVTIPYGVPPGPGTVVITYYVVEELTKWYGPLTREIYVLLGDSQPGGIAGSESTTDSVTVATPDSTTEASAVAVTGEPEASTTPARTCITSSMEGYECMQKVRKLVTFVADKKTSLLKFVGGHSQLPRKLRMKTGENFTWLIHPYFAFHALKDFYTLHWAIGQSKDQGRRRKLSQELEKTPEEGEILFAMEGKTNGWVALGFAEEAGSMAPADAVIGWIDDGNSNVKSYRITGYDVNEGNINNSMSIRVVGSSEVDEVTVIEFIRAAAVGNVAVALDKAIYINYAIGNEDRLVEHPSNGKGSLRLNLASGQAHALKSPREVMYLAHGSLMVIAWLGFIPLGILVARHKWSPSSLGESGWLDVHRLVILFAMISYFTAVIIAVSKFESQHSMIGKTHVVFSVLVFLCLFVQIMLGVFRPKPASSRRQLFSNTHGWLGRSLALLAVFTIFLGISALKTKLQIDVIGWVAAVIILSVAHICVGLTAEMVLMKKKRLIGSIPGEVDMPAISSQVPYTRGLD